MYYFLSNYIFIIFLISTTITLKFNPKTVGTKLDNNTISETLSDLALKRLYHRLKYFNETSCKKTATFVMLSIGGVTGEDSLKTLTLSKKNITFNMKNIRILLNRNNIVQIELSKNHHFVIFKKNYKDLYLIHSFENVINIRDWMNDENIMKPYLTFDDFFNNFEKLFVYKNKKEKENAILNLFYPNVYGKYNEEDKNKILNWFKDEIKLINVYYVPFTFNQNQNNKDFINFYNEVFNSYNITVNQLLDSQLINNKKNYNKKYGKEQKNI